MSDPVLREFNIFISSSVSVECKFHWNGDPGGIYITQRVILHSDYNKAALELTHSPLRPDRLRKLADEIDLNMEAAKKESVKEDI